MIKQISPMKGKRHSEESRQKMRDSHKGIKLSADHIKNIAKSNTGKKRSDESRQRMSAAQKGKLFTTETRKKMSERKKGKPSPRKGIKLSDVECKKISERMLGFKHSIESRSKISAKLTGKQVSAETRQKLSDVWKTRAPISESSRKKMSDSHKDPSYYTRMKISEYQVGGFWYGNVKNDIGIKELIRGLTEYRSWIKNCLIRDEYKDKTTGKKCLQPNVHHIISIDTLIRKYNIKTLDDARKCKELWDMNNGITMEKENHIKLHGYHYD